MAETHKEWLARLAERSREQQETFMDGIASRLGHPRLIDKKPEHPYRGAPEFWRTFEWSLEEKVEHFTDNFESVGGHVARLGAMSEVTDFVAQKASEMSAKYLITQNQDEIQNLQLAEAMPDVDVAVWNSDQEVNWKTQAAQADFGVVVADHAVAYTGSVTVLSSGEKGRSVSLLPTVLFIIIPVDRMKTRLGEVLVPLDAIGREALPAGIHFITGPSRSSDIENDLTIGVHGPGIVYALLVG